MHFLHHSFPKLTPRRHDLIRIHDLFQFQCAVHGFDFHPSIGAQLKLADHIRHFEFHHFGMRIRGDDGIALSLIRDGQGHQRGMPALAR